MLILLKVMVVAILSNLMQLLLMFQQQLIYQRIVLKMLLYMQVLQVLKLVQLLYNSMRMKLQVLMLIQAQV